MIKKQQGFTFIETLIALCLLSIVLLGATRTILLAQRMQEEAWFRTIAINQLYNIQTIIQINRLSWFDFYSKWQQQNKQLLPEGFGSASQKDHRYLISISWHSKTLPFWHCQSSRIVGRNCLEMKVL